MFGILNIFKEAGPTSFDVVKKIRLLTKTKKVGHGGTLDPLAQGVLPVFLGESTKLIPFLPDRKKTYRGIMILGVTSSTDDAEGTLENVSSFQPSFSSIEEVCQTFLGESEQLPPAYSSVHYKGKRLYQLARKGIRCDEIKPRKAYVYQLEVISYNYPQVSFRITTAEGFYVRSFCRDTGKKLGTGAYLSELVRERSGPFTITDTVSLSQISLENLETFFMPLEKILFPLPVISLADNEAEKFKHGQFLEIPQTEELKRFVQVYHNKQLIGIGEIILKNDFYFIKPKRVL